MPISRHRPPHIELIAESTLSKFANTADSAKSALEQERPQSPDVFANLNTVNDYRVLQSLSHMSDERRRAFRILCDEPAIARIVALDDAGREATYFIARAP
jgi:hypothetical protein